MENKEIIRKYGITKNTGLAMVFQVALVMIALILTMIGLYKANEAKMNITIVYISQAVAFISIIIFGLVNFKNRNVKDFKLIINAYTIFLALQASLLNVSTYNYVIGVLLRFIIIILACNCILFSERLERKDSVYISYVSVALEVIMYIIFIVGVPDSLSNNLIRGLMFSGVIMSGSICLFHKARIQQIKNKN